MVKARGTTRRGGFKPGLEQLAEIEEINIAAWCPDEKAQQPPEQVHLTFTIKGIPEWPMVVRFKSPDTMGFLIEELTRYRREVWPDAEPVNFDVLKKPAIELLRRELGDEFTQWYRERRQLHGVKWWLPERWHFEGGMAIRNLLRQRGFDEKYFGIGNLDNIYIKLVEDAMAENGD